MDWDGHRDAAQRADLADPGPARRDAFALPDGVAYLDGNSLGPLTHAARDAVQHAVGTEWGRGLITSWETAGWMTLARRTGDRVAAIVGAPPGSVVCADSTTINLHKCLRAAVALRPGRRRLLAQSGNFPTDTYAAHRVAADLGLTLDLRPAEALADALDDDVAVVLASHVDYRTARIHDMPGLTAAAHAVGALTVWDLAHSAGAIPCDLLRAGADLAVGCGYKYLNGGPGAPAFVYVAPHLGEVPSPLPGWFGHRDPFAFAHTHTPAPGAEGFQAGTTPVLGMTALHAALEVFAGVDMAALRDRSSLLTELFRELADTHLQPLGFAWCSPRDPAVRGSHVTLAHPRAARLIAALTREGVVGDHRPPDQLRFGFAPLYTTRAEVVRCAETLARLAAQHSDSTPSSSSP